MTEAKAPAKTRANIRARVVGGLLYALTAALLAGAYAVDYFGHARMGMARHLVYLRRKWDAALPLGELRVVAVVLTLALVVLLVAAWARSPHRGRPATIVAAGLGIVLAGLHVWYVAFVSPEQVRAAILVSPLLGLAALVALGHGLALALCSSRA